MNRNYLFACIIILCCSCRAERYIYSPSPPSVPYFKEKGDSKLTAFYSVGDNAPQTTLNAGYDLQGAYALSDNWAVMFNYFHRTEKDNYSRLGNVFDTSAIRYRRNLAELGIGYILPLNRKHTITYNIYTGVAFGTFAIEDNGVDKNNLAYSRQHTNPVTKTFLQGGFNFMTSDYVNLSLCGRFSWVHYGTNNTNYTTEELVFFYLDKLPQKTLFFFEPSFDMQFGLPQINWLKLETSFTLTAGNLPGFYPHSRSVNTSIGLTADIGKLFTKH